MRSLNERESTNFIVKVRKMKPSKKDFRNVAHTHVPKNVYKRERYRYEQEEE